MDDETSNRRRFLEAAAATGLATALAGCSSGGESTTTTDADATDGDGTDATTSAADTTTADGTAAPDETTDDEAMTADAETATGDGGTASVTVGPNGEFVFDPETVSVRPGATVRWEWDSDNHSIVPDGQPDGADWAGTDGDGTTTYDSGHVHEHTFEVAGEYEYHCAPHQAVGMQGTVLVGVDADAPIVFGGNEPSEVAVGADGEYVFDPGTDEPPTVRPGTEVTFVWDSDNHSITVDDQPADADWTGTSGEVQDSGFEHTHTFTVEGRYEYHCDPHESLGMVGELVVESE